MSSDMMTNQISKDMPKSPVATETSKSAQMVAQRQAAALNGGNVLPPEQKAEQPSQEDLGEAVKQLNQYVQQIQRDLLFSVDDSSGRTVIRVVNSETDEVVRQIPSEEVLRIMRALQEQMDDSAGLIFDTSA